MATSGTKKCAFERRLLALQKPPLCLVDSKIAYFLYHILLLDEPTKGFDAEFKVTFATILHRLTAQGVTILMVSHDVPFCAEYAHKCGLFFDGSIAAEGTPREFFSGNSFYTTPANRMARHLIPQAVTVADIIGCCGGEVPAEPPIPEEAPLPAVKETAVTWKPKPLPLWRKVLAAFGAFSAIVICGGIMNPASALMYNAQSVNWNMILGYYITGLSMDLVHAAATVACLLLIAEPMLQKLDRIKVKYGMVE